VSFIGERCRRQAIPVDGLCFDGSSLLAQVASTGW
jgi:hypothetical protein